MALRAESLSQELIDRVGHLVATRLEPSKAPAAGRFAQHFYAHVPPADILKSDPEALYGAAMAALTFARQRKAGEAKVRAYNPQIDEHGWASEHTVVEIVNDDMPFLVDSVTAEILRQGLSIHLVIHPIVRISRDKAGKLLDVKEANAAENEKGNGKGEDGFFAESVMHFQVSQQTETEALARIAEGIKSALADVRAAVEDWRKMRAAARGAIEELDKPPAGLPASEIEETKAFLTWLEADHFTFLGYRDYLLTDDPKAPIAMDEKSGLGLLRDPERRVLEELQALAELPPEVKAFVARPKILFIAKANSVSTVHRAVHMDTVGVKRFDAKGNVTGLRIFAGLFTADVYTSSPTAFPMLREKIVRVIAKAGFPAASHAGKRLLYTLENLPRDELFQASDEHLFDTAMGIVHLQERQRIALFVRKDEFERFVSCLVFVPRDRYDTHIRLAFQAILERAYAGQVSAHYTQVGDAPLARVHLIVKTQPGRIPDADVGEIEKQLTEAGRSWTDRLEESLVAAKGEDLGLRLRRRYGKAFPAAYRERFNAQGALHDIQMMEEAAAGDGFGLNLYRPVEAPESEVRLKLYHRGRTLALSDVLPMLEHMGFRVISELPFPIHFEDGSESVYIHDFAMECGAEIDLRRIREPVQEAFRRVWLGDMEDDGFNRLVVLAGIPWREVVILRAYAKYLRQAGFTFSQAYIEATLARYPAIAALLVERFLAAFDPKGKRRAEAEIEAEILHALDQVDNADEDRILRRYLNLLRATLRTNFFQPAADGKPKDYVSFKLDSKKVDDLPAPRPNVEVWVYSPRVEAIHLRGGKVARGGIRWSDRREDFRTEILGLIKAQMVKNAVIVPVGAKGGFVVKRPPAEGGREAFLEEGIACYKTLMRGLLDITDNFRAGKTIAPKDVVRKDEEDPYLVVAADKGTATFSDIANGISLDYGHWLGDAFASGGSKGYDHKKMGITARGAWVSVMRHFREMGIDTQSQDFTCVGVGDMAGDVFGNGMLQSPHIKLVGAFNHLHIFIDPNPTDLAKCFAERKRMFDLPRSNWTDYDKSLISPGGGIFERKAKSIALSPEIKALLEIEKDQATPAELIRALLCAKVDLLFFGGIGTYIKAQSESNADAGDRANDSLRIDGKDIRARVVGEGANLGCTQKGRVEYALKGGRINTDAIDNSAGVDCSDHEVNIKILLNELVAEGDMTEKQRVALLSEMTEDVAALVLRDNYLQTQALSLFEAQGADRLDQQERLMRMLEKLGRLDRAIEYLPNEEAVAERAAAKKGLVRPELAVLLAYAKIWLFDEIIASDLPDDPLLVSALERYFPPQIRARHGEAMKKHRLRREIVATAATNSMINRVGGGFLVQMIEKTGLSAVDAARAYLVVRECFQLRALWDEIESLDGKVPATLQIAMLAEINRLIDRAVIWLLRNGGQPLDIAGAVKEFAAGVAELAGNLGAVLPDEAAGALKSGAERFKAEGAPGPLADKVANLIVLASAFDIVRIAAARGLPVAESGRIYFAAGVRFGLGWLRFAAERSPAATHWQKLAVAAVIEEFYAHQRDLTLRVLEGGGGQDAAPAVDSWAIARRAAVERVDQLLAEMKSAPSIDLAMLAVASRAIRAAAEA